MQLTCLVCWVRLWAQSLSTAFAYLKNCHDSKRRNSRPEPEKLHHKRYIETWGDFASLVGAESFQLVHVESWFRLSLTGVHDWCHISRVKCYFPVLGLNTDLCPVWFQGMELRSALPKAPSSCAGCRLEKPWGSFLLLVQRLHLVSLGCTSAGYCSEAFCAGHLERWHLGWLSAAPRSV